MTKSQKATKYLIAPYWWFKKPRVICRGLKEVDIDWLDERCLFLWKKALTISEISTLLNISVDVVKQWWRYLKEAGVLIKERDIEMKYPAIELEITSKCNAKCIMCPRDILSQHRGFSHMSKKTFDAVLNNIGGRGVKKFYLCGIGEPLLNPLFFEMVESIRKVDPKTKIICTSNGSTLTPCIHDKILSSEIDVLEVSIHSLDPVIHRSILRSFNVEVVIDNLEKLLSKKEKLGHGPIISINQVLVSIQPDECKILSKWALSKEIKLHTWRAWNRAGNIPEYVLTEDLLEPRNFHQKNQSPSICRDYEEILFIDYQGNALSCCCDSSNETMELSAVECSLEKMVAYRVSKLTSNKPLSSICMKCDAPATNKQFLDTCYFSSLNEKWSSRDA